ncbi:SGNH/GDSL hydrolase family protein [Nocardioides sp.]|uniref:SGNH/GDSL hydrolase family protein n=1 Tax=Nocardioides sp. TaxID=35761 RepID=UPI00271B47FF|nr:SGNH/GDSL hydrolase family protein [Nocardioides sp.]MDO9457270.1 SGNH/GDSL hydrolase family protein [Nocardioides sp.]
MELGTALTRRRLVASLVVLAIALGLTVFAVARATGGAPVDEVSARCQRAAERAEERRSLDTGTGPAVVVIGDSYSVGAGVDLLQSWPTRLPGRVHVDGFSGSGFSATASPCGAVSYADRAARAVAGRPGALVVVEGGLNDHAQNDYDIQRGFVRLMQVLAGHPVLVVGPPPAPSRAAEVPRVDAALARMATGFGASYLSLAQVDLDYLDDDLHPTVRGQRKLGRLVAAEVARLL